MTPSEQPATKKDLCSLKTELTEVIRALFEEYQSKPHYYSPRKFSEVTGMPYSTVVEHCTKGLIKAHQERPGSTWLIEEGEIHSEPLKNNGHGHT